MGTPLLWITFNAFVLLMLAVDLGVFHRRPHAISFREAAGWSIFWVTISLLFNLGLLHWYGRTRALEFFTGYLIEKSLSVDNIFVFVLLFRYFGVESRYQHRVLFWGILGALVMRGAMIAAGVTLIRRFEWVLYLFGAFLVYAGVKMMFHKAEQIHPERNPVFRWARKFLPVTREYEGQRFFVRREGLWRATPLFLVLLVIETTDLAFALDSIPAIFAITRDAFIVYTSNVFAILGLRAFYFLLAGVLPYFRYLSHGLSLVLTFIGLKMLGEHWVHISTGVALGVVGFVLSVAVIASVAAAQAESRALRRLRLKEAQRGRPHAAAPTREAAELASLVARLSHEDPALRQAAAAELYQRGCALAEAAVRRWRGDAQLGALLSGPPTVGIAVEPDTFENIRARAGLPHLAQVPADQDAREFELNLGAARLDILTTRSTHDLKQTSAPAAGAATRVGGAIGRFLEKFGEGIQQVEYPTTDVDRATELLRARFGLEPVYAQSRPGADGTRVNFFLARTDEGKKVLIELVETPRGTAG